MSKEKKRKDPVIILLDIVIVALIFAMIYVGQSFIFYLNRMNEDSFGADAGRMAFDLQRGDYTGFIQSKYMNGFNGDTKNDGYYSLAEYFEASFAYKVYDAKGYTEKANETKSVMERDRAQMGELTVFADKADKLFE